MNKNFITAKCVILAISLIDIAHADSKNWTGLYAGADAGVGFYRAELTSQQLAFTSPNETCNKSSNYSTFSPGAQLGYAYQFSHAVVAGIEINTTFNTDQTQTYRCTSEFNPDVYDSFTFKNHMQTALKGRIARAFIWNEHTLLPYVTTGASFANLELSYRNEGGDHYSDTTTGVAWIIGAGLEWAFMEHWSVRAEYNYLDYGNAINVRLPTVYDLYDRHGEAQVNLTSSIVAAAISYWF